MTLSRRGLVAAGAAFPFALRRASAQPQAGVLRYGLSAFPPNLNPWVSTGVSAGTVKLMTNRSLLSWGPKGELRPELAESYSRDADGAWVFRLRGDAVFHNGEKVTAEDVKWTIEQIASERSTAYMRTQFQAIARVETPDPRTVRIVTKAPLAVLPTWWPNYNVHVIWHGSQPNAPIGCGPYRVAAQERGTAIEVEAFDRYYKPGLPRIKRIRFVAYPDENLRFAALQAGDVDMIEYLPWQSMTNAENDPRLAVQSADGPFMDILFNGSRGPFADARVRRAVAHAVRREEIVKAAFFGRGSVLEGVPIARDTPWFDEELSRGWRYDPARAKALLAEAGVPNGFSTVMLSTAQFGMHKDTAEIVQQNLAEIGIQCELRLPDWSTRVNLGTRGQYEIAIHGVAADSNDPDGLAVIMDTSLSPTYSRSFNLPAPRTTDAFNRGRAEFDQARRVEIYKEMQRAALEEVPLIGLAWRSQAFGLDKRVRGFQVMPGALSLNSAGLLDEVSFA